MYRVTKNYGHSRGFSCAFRQWSADSHCKNLHGYSLGFKIVLESPTLDINNWVYDFGNFEFLDKWLSENFDHTLLIAKDDPELHLLKSLNKVAAKVIVLDKISCEYFAEITFKFIQQSLAELDVEVVSVEVSEHESNSAGFYRS
ncbi:MAG: 6-pyruvoyl tetrahydrobiopterin synthase [Gammaproteobacteria bacterium TMED112]|nr:MAG: 6-pyruvoyl tetrahydrobiopterin synthase [Gammaproteobacteria bacterium TMED112]|tara:strand:+ start:8693 stop:9124 length:432 start_codon:yes stop_codon:yes gene_type:complete